ncbi:MAG TPA: F0F1 ATP synthase subunit A [Acidimicrobiia bacterium]|nr:F0F1 ATP synthase subunit A [Acidimicrobiia bacterium]
MTVITGALDFPPVSHLLEWPDFLLKGSLLGINKVVLLTIMGAVLVVVFFWAAGRRQAVVPSGAQNLGEMAIEFVERDIVVNVMGPEAKHWTPFIASIFFFILALNLLGLVPVLQMPVNARMALPMYLALQTWLLMILVGFKHQGFKFIPNTLFPPGVPKALMPLLAFIELLSVFILRPFTLMVRLFANLMAGHMLLTTFYVLSSALFVKSVLVVALPLPVFMAIFVTAFELLVALLQAYIFSILTAVYISESMHGH